MFKLLLLISSIFSLSSHAAPMTLREALKYIPQHPKQLAYNLDTQKAQVTKTKSLLNLMPALSGAWQKSSTTTAEDLNNPTWKLSADINLFQSLGDYNNIRARSFLLNSTQFTEDSALLENELKLAETYLRCLYSQNIENAALEAYRIGQQIADIEKNRFNKGIKSRDDYLKLKVDAENRRIRYISESTSRESCYADLAYWVGTVTSLVDPKLLPREPNFKSLPTGHPRMKAALSALDARKSIANTYVSTNLPRVDFSYARTYNENPQTYENLILLTAKWNLFDSGQTLSDIRLSFLDVKKSEESLKDTERDLARETSTLGKSLSQYLRQYKIAEENLRDIQLTFKTSLARFRAGAISANEVALDQSRVVEATFAFDNLWLQMNTAYLRYQSSLGNSVSQVLGDAK